ncbi:hypothetical protein BDQ17DRAFT_1201898, partial [Cyathus striatus]
LTLYDIPEHKDQQIRCLAHIINLVAQAMLSSLDEVEECTEDGSDTDHFLLNKNMPIHYDIEDNIEVKELEANRDVDVGFRDEFSEEKGLYEAALDEEEASDVGQSALKRLRFITNKITSSPQWRQRFWKFSSEIYGKTKQVDDTNPHSALLSKLMVIRDIRTHWNSTHAMIAQAVTLRKRDWERLEHLWKLLDLFTMHTQQLSMSRCPTIPFVLPIYDLLEKHLNAASVNFDLPMELRTSAGVGVLKLLKYKEDAVTNHNYILGTVLHPFMRTEWFHKV